MNILQVIPYFAPAWDYGGPVQVAYRLSENLVKRGHEVTVYSTDTLDAGNRINTLEETINGIKVKRFRNLNNSLAFNHKIFLSTGMYRDMKKEIGNFDIVHLHEYRTFQNLIVHRQAVKHRIPYIIQSHGAMPRILTKKKLKGVFDSLWGYGLLGDAAAVIALTGTEAEQYREMRVDERKVSIIPNGIEFSEYEKLPEKGEFRKKYSLDAGEKLVLYLGRIHKSKGIDLLVKAFAGLKKEMDDIRLIIAGPDDGYLIELKALVSELQIEENILFTGAVYDEEKLAAYVDANIFVTPSFSGFPVTFLEASACGLPVITTEKGDKLDWIDNQTGFVVEFDEILLKDAISRILLDNELAGQYGTRAKQLVKERFNWQVISEQLELLYSKIIGS